MGIRMDQFMGLSPEAVAFLQENEKQPRVCYVCKRPLPRKLDVIEHFYGMFNDKYPLHRHFLQDGVADEFLQESPWSSGPMFFLGLRVGDKEFCWTEAEIDEAA